MALCWPDKKVALDIVNEPAEITTYRRRDGWTVVRVYDEDLVDYDTFRKVTDRVAKLLGSDVPQDPEWQKNNRQLHALLTSGAA